MSYRAAAATAALLLASAAPLLAQEASGDAAAGEKVFKQCMSCHVVQNAAGEVLAGKNAKTGPNLFGVAGREAGVEEGFSYGASMEEAMAKGLHWDEAHFVSYVMDPSGFLKSYLGDDKARAKMTFKVKKEEDAANVYAYIASLK